MKPGIHIIRLKQPDRFIMWVKFQWFKFTRPDEYHEMKQRIDELYERIYEKLGL